MKSWKKASKSIYRAILYIQDKPDELTGLSVSDRYFVPEGVEDENIPLSFDQSEVRYRNGFATEGRNRRADQFHKKKKRKNINEQKKWNPDRMGWEFIEGLLFFLPILGVTLMVTSGFAIPVTLWFYPVLLLLYLGFYAAFSRKGNGMKGFRKFLLVIGGIIASAVYLIILQKVLYQGALGSYVKLIDRINMIYDGSLNTGIALEGEASISVFLLTVLTVLMALYLFLTLRQNNLILTAILFLPMIAVLLICGAGRSAAALFILFFGLLALFVYARNIERKRLWGGDREALYKKNQQRFHQIRGKSMLGFLIICMAISIPGFYMVRPLLGITLAPAESRVTAVQSKFLNYLLKTLPDISAGQWNLQTETVAGGVSEGALGEDEGYELNGVEDLTVTLSAQPEETIFLKGYIGSRYEEGSWKEGYESSFLASAFNWNVEGDPKIYIQNLPFLRITYIMEQESYSKKSVVKVIDALKADPYEMTVENMAANDKYTYVPYGAYLNDYYELEGGDGSVLSTDVADNQYFYYNREMLQGICQAWNRLEDTSNVLDRVEEGYYSYCRNSYLDVEENLSSLQDEIQAVVEEERWDPQENIEEITGWIRAYLTDNYSYDLKVKAVPEGEDFLDWFLNQSKTGYSIHFASAATEMYRMFGVPARYVVGYEAPSSIFTVQNEGRYQAVLQDDNSQAWTEIYHPGVGWMPEDMTPGSVGTLEEIGPGGERIEMNTGDPAEADTQLEADTKPISPENLLASRAITLEETIHFFIKALIGILLLSILVLGYRFLTKTFGYDPFHRRSPMQRLLDSFRACYALLLVKGLSKDIDSESEAFDTFARSFEEPLAAEILGCRDGVYQCLYGDDDMIEDTIVRLRRLYLNTLKTKAIKEQK